MRVRHAHQSLINYQTSLCRCASTLRPLHPPTLNHQQHYKQQQQQHQQLKHQQPPPHQNQTAPSPPLLPLPLKSLGYPAHNSPDTNGALHAQTPSQTIAHKSSSHTTHHKHNSWEMIMQSSSKRMSNQRSSKGRQMIRKSSGLCCA